MPKRIIVPEVDERPYLEEHLRRIRLKHEAQYGKLPHVPDNIPLKTMDDDGTKPIEKPIRNTSPSTLDKLWANKWNLVRHFIIDGGGAAIAALTTTKNLTVAGGAFVVGGIVGAARKGFDDNRRAAGKPDFLTTARNLVKKPVTRGDGMGIRAEVYEVKAELVRVGNILTDDIPNSQQLTEGMAAVLGVIKEGSDFKDIPQQERAKAIGHAFIMAGAEIYDTAVKYSDEVEPNA